MEKIKFSENWNNKLDNNVFSTIRKYSNSKFDFYKENLNDEFEVYLKTKNENFVPYCTAILRHMKFMQLQGLTKNELMLDVGLTSPAAIFEVFEIFGIKHMDYIIHLIFERID